MSDFESDLDTEIYNMIQQLMGSMPGKATRERRREKRNAYPAVQRVAVRRGLELPAESDFLEVQCHDLTRNGFSFLLPSEAKFDSIVAAFGRAPNVIYVAAQVVRCTPVIIQAGGEFEPVGQRPKPGTARQAAGRAVELMFLVGCRFTERVCVS